MTQVFNIRNIIKSTRGQICNSTLDLFLTYSGENFTIKFYPVNASPKSRNPANISIGTCVAGVNYTHCPPVQSHFSVAYNNVEIKPPTIRPILPSPS